MIFMYLFYSLVLQIELLIPGTVFFLLFLFVFLLFLK